MDGETGILVPPRDADALAEQILRVLADKALAEELGRAGRERVQSYFTIQRVVDEVEEIYAQVCEPCMLQTVGAT